MNKIIKYTGTYRGIGYEICNWEMKDYMSDDPEAMKQNWTYYIYIHLNMIPEESNPDSYWLKAIKFKITPDSIERIRYKYDEHHVIGNLPWHGGCTWYSKESNQDDVEMGIRVVKVGCDYQHYWDEGRQYDVDMLLQDVQDTIDKLREMIPGYKYRCSWNGKLYDISEGELNRESFISNEGKAVKDKSI
jgi:hypothetical protein